MFMRRSTIVAAFQWDGKPGTLYRICEAVKIAYGKGFDYRFCNYPGNEEKSGLFIPFGAGETKVRENDFIVFSSKDEPPISVDAAWFDRDYILVSDTTGNVVVTPEERQIAEMKSRISRLELQIFNEKEISDNTVKDHRRIEGLFSERAKEIHKLKTDNFQLLADLDKAKSSMTDEVKEAALRERIDNLCRCNNNQMDQLIAAGQEKLDLEKRVKDLTAERDRLKEYHSKALTDCSMANRELSLSVQKLGTVMGIEPPLRAALAIIENEKAAHAMMGYKNNKNIVG